MRVTKYLVSGEEISEEKALASEFKLRLIINGKAWKTVVCSENELKELAVGALFTGKGFAYSDIDAVEIDGNCAEIRLKAPLSRKKNLSPVPKRKWSREEVFGYAETFDKTPPLYERTGAVHGCMLFRGKKLLYRCEDLGRHNAVDKAIGFALINGVSLSYCAIYCSGRVPTDMMKKFIFAGIPVVVSHSAPTAQAVSLAKKYNLTLIASARTDYFIVYADGAE